MSKSFEPCEICTARDWRVTYEGPIRDGSFGKLTKESVTVRRCGRCDADRLEESACKDADFYENERYRKSLEEPTDTAGFMTGHDEWQLQNLRVLWPESLRNKIIADIGCGAGSFLDHVSGLCKKVIAIDPCKLYHESLSSRGYSVYSVAGEAAGEWAGKIDFAFSFSVVEHVLDPRLFLSEINEILTEDGKLLISTPNRCDALLTLGEQIYRQFFYRVAHRWYFDGDSFASCAREAGFDVVKTHYVQRFGLSNAMAWLRDGKPIGHQYFPYMDSALLDGVWKAHLENQGVSDYLYFILKRRADYKKQ